MEYQSNMAKIKTTNDSEVNSNATMENATPLACGIIMPIANTQGYREGHWGDVYAILCDAASKAGFEPKMVSFDEDVSVIHKRIVQNIYSNPIVICDISSKNPNVMFELGMRLAFDKPTIIVKDDKTPYSFDISSIEHVEYPSDLRYQTMNDFKCKLEAKIIETYKRSIEDPEFSTFLKQFGTFKIAKLNEKEVGINDVLLEEVRDLKRVVNSQAYNPAKVYNGQRVQILRPSALGWGNNESYMHVLTMPNIGLKFKEFMAALQADESYTEMNFLSVSKIDNDSIQMEFKSMPHSNVMAIVNRVASSVVDTD
jgi:hypothetical protein